MVHPNPTAVFRALGDPSRLEIVSRLAGGPQTATDMIAPLGMTLQAVRKHLAVLEGAGMVSSVKRGRVRLCRLETGPMQEAEDWMRNRSELWRRRLVAFGASFDEGKRP